MNINLDGRAFVLEKMAMGTKYVGRFTFKTIKHENPFYDASISFDADMSLAFREVEQLKKENEYLKNKLNQMGQSTSDLKSKFIGEYKLDVERWNHDNEAEYYESVAVPWTLQKEIFKDMCEYVKNRKDEDIVL